MKTIAIMRPAQHLQGAIELAESYGYRVIAAPMVGVKEKNDLEFDVFVQRVLNRSIDYVVFTSVNGVLFALKKARSYIECIDALNACVTVAIGPSTKQGLEKHGIHVDIMPKMYSSDGIVSALASYIKGKKIEIVRSSRGSPALIEGLKKHGAYVHEVQVYDITRPVAETQRKLIEAGLNNEIDVYVFTSAMTVRNFLRTAEDLGKKNEMIKMTNQKTVAALGNPTAEALRENGIHVDVIPERFTFRDVLDELEKRCGV